MKSIDADIKNGTFRRFYFLYGKERYLKNYYRNRLKEAVGAGDMNTTSYIGKGVNIREVIDLAETMPFLSDHRLILLEDTQLDKDSCETLADYIPQMPDSTVIVMTESEPDRRTKLFRSAEKGGFAIEFGEQDERTLTTWILSRCKKEGKKITSGAVNELIVRCGKDMVGLATELEKLFCYTYGREGITLEDVNAVCAKLTEASIFDMIEDVSRGKLKEALGIYYEMLSNKEPAMRILFLLCKQFNQLLQVRLLLEEGLNIKAIGEKMHLGEWLIRKLRDIAQQYDKATLRGAVEECVELEEAVKTGKLDENLSVELIIIKYGSNHTRQKEGARNG
ncbi:MAG: DNA polymerase III subunit delta [Lachnospiraceae bacterium]|nr:DNA polymerase III subunit delta [Lachnospiraceae bacterium]